GSPADKQHRYAAAPGSVRTRMTPARYMMADVSWHPTSAVSLERFLFAIARTTRSVLPPGGKETMKLIGPAGNSCPKPWPPSAKRTVSAAAVRMARRAIIKFVSFRYRQDYTHNPPSR